MKMKITKQRLVTIIKEELEKVIEQEEKELYEDTEPSSDDFETQIKEWVALGRELEDFKQKIKVLSAKSEMIEKKILPVIKEMEGQKAIVDNSIVSYKERNVTSPSYKSMFEVALTKVNAATKQILLEIQEQFTKRSVKGSLNLDEGMGDFFRSLLGKVNVFKKSVSDLQKVANMEEGAKLEEEEKKYGKYNFKYHYDKNEEDMVSEMIEFMLERKDPKEIVMAIVNALGVNALGVVGNAAEDLGIRFPNDDLETEEEEI